MATYSNEKLAELMAKLGTKAADNVFKKKLDLDPPREVEDKVSPYLSDTSLVKTTDRYGKEITLNQKQSEAVAYAASGQSFVLIGAAGTGKTTCQGASVQALIQNGHAPVLHDISGHKTLVKGNPGIAIVAFTRRAVANIKKSLPEHLKSCCMTIHKLIQFEPEYEDYEDENGLEKKKMTFKPAFHKNYPLPAGLKWIIFEESSMVGTDLYKQVQEAMPHIHNEIFLGDIQQIPPVFGPAILGFKLLELPVVELTEVYRQALESPILSLAWKILRGEDIPEANFPSLSVQGKLKLHPWTKKLSPEDALLVAANFFKKAYDTGAYHPGRDIVLMAQNVKFGTVELNNYIASHIAKRTDAIIHHVIAGYRNHYFRIGETIMVDKEDATIVDIQPNPKYFGKPAKLPSKEINYWGHEIGGNTSSIDTDIFSEDEVEALLLKVQAMDEDGEERVNQASHTITVKYLDKEGEYKFSDAGSINSILLGYALTVHKSQGSEWENVFFVSHSSNGRMLQRELVYTAITRAKEYLYVICAPDMFQRSVKSQAIKGNTLAEKAEFFKGKAKKFMEEQSES